MTTFEITAVRTEQPVGYEHPHITRVWLNGSTSAGIPRQTVIDDLNSPTGDRYFTLGGGLRANVIVGHCPFCSYSEYITTEPDSTIENNLLSLPRL